MTRFLSQFVRKNSKELKAFTLVEVLISASIFTIVSLIGIVVFVNVMRIQRRVALENAIYEDARVMMERIAREIRSNTVDYEEYYNKALKIDPLFASFTGLVDAESIRQHNPYGNRYGCYAKRFYNPGKDNAVSGDAGPEYGGFGARCSNGAAANPDCIIDRDTLDINTGQNPFAGYSTSPNGYSTVANAFCDRNFDGDVDASCGQPADTDHNIQDELYLINAVGTEKTLMAKKEVTSGSGRSPVEHALALLRLDGQDNDKDGVTETWGTPLNGICDSLLPPYNAFCCAPGFECGSIPPLTGTVESTLSYNATSIYKGFVPISPTRTDVVSLKFFVSPLEDPRKAFAETEPGMGIQQQPHVTVVLTVQPSASSRSGYTDVIPTITIQTTVASRVYNEVKSYYVLPSGVTGVCKSYT